MPDNQMKLPMKKRWIAFALSLVLLMLFAAPACASYADLAAKYSARGGVKLWEGSDGLGYARWEDASNDKLNFRPKVYSHSTTLTLRAVELYYYATDVWGDPVYGENQYYRHTSKLTLKPGEKAYTDWVALPERREIDRVYCGIKRLSYSDGTIVEFDDDEIEFISWTIE
ncbi:MAG: hypothetical protein ACI4MP_10180 [Candidatus Ventricola sp.]